MWRTLNTLFQCVTSVWYLLWRRLPYAPMALPHTPLRFKWIDDQTDCCAGSKLLVECLFCRRMDCSGLFSSIEFFQKAPTIWKTAIDLLGSLSKLNYILFFKPIYRYFYFCLNFECDRVDKPKCTMLYSNIPFVSLLAIMKQSLHMFVFS